MPLFLFAKTMLLTHIPERYISLKIIQKYVYSVTVRFAIILYLVRSKNWKMKKIYTLLAAALCFGTAANAQRIIDLQTTMSSPAAGSTITSGNTITVNSVVKNLSSQMLKTTDTVLYGFTVDGSLLSFGGTTTFYKTGKQLNQNDTLQINASFSINFPSSANGAHTFCVLAIPYNKSADSVKDNVTTNNSGCAAVTFAGGTAGVENITAEIAANTVGRTYPNPASSEVNLDLNLGGNNDVTVQVYDLTGRVVMSEDKGYMSKGNHTLKINTAALVKGMYIYRVNIGTETSTGKFTIIK